MSARTRPAGNCGPANYKEILRSGFRPGPDFLALDGNLGALASCLLAAPHGGKIEPVTRKIVKAVADLGPWAWYSFEGRLHSRNWQRLLTSTSYDDPRLLALLPQTMFVIAVHGMDGSERRVEIGGKFATGRAVFTERLRMALNPWAATVWEADGTGAKGDLARGNLVNRGTTRQGVQIEISRGLRNLLWGSSSRSCGPPTKWPWR
jgi:phage replication-related protein YjqB (UPF0714/DUF867 family)